MTMESSFFDWGSFLMGVAFTTGIVVLFDLVRSKRNLRDSKLEITELKKKLSTKKDKDKTKK